MSQLWAQENLEITEQELQLLLERDKATDFIQESLNVFLFDHGLSLISIVEKKIYT